MYAKARGSQHTSGDEAPKSSHSEVLAVRLDPFRASQSYANGTQLCPTRPAANQDQFVNSLLLLFLSAILSSFATFATMIQLLRESAC